MENLVKDEFWKGRRVFVTGHTGFKGGWLTLWLQRLGAEVAGYALPPPSAPTMFQVASIGETVESQYGDVRDLAALSKAIHKFEPEVIFHLAAQSLVGASYRDPIGTYATNVLGLVNLLEAVRKITSVRAVLIVTSDKCYENREWIWGYREDEALGGYDPYSSSKGCAELVVAAYRRSFFRPGKAGDLGVAIATARAGNVVGGGDWAEDRLIPDFIRAMSAGEELRVRAPGSIRPWQHVLEPLSGYLSLARRLVEDGVAYAEAWNFGPHDRDSVSVSWIADHLVTLWGNNARWVVDGDSHYHEATRLKLDISKATQRLQWAPRWSVGQALDMVVKWHRSHLAGENMRGVTQAQIAAYERSGA